MHNTQVTMHVVQLDRAHAVESTALMNALHVSLFGISSRRLHAALISDGLAGRLDCRIAIDPDHVCGIVLAAPAAYWRSGLLRHWGVAAECVAARLTARQSTHNGSAVEPAPAALPAANDSLTEVSWQQPGGAWRIIFVGTAPSARGRGVAASLYRSVMRDRSLVARIAPTNHASLRLHESLGWCMRPDGDVAVAIYERKDR